MHMKGFAVGLSGRVTIKEREVLSSAILLQFQLTVGDSGSTESSILHRGLKEVFEKETAARVFSG